MPFDPNREETAAKHEVYKAILGGGEVFAEQIGNLLPPCRERSMALTKIEEAIFWAQAGAARA